ncbi:MAG: peptide chain release factor N(5)-glutamine methyltransferase [Pseudomonadota bacterium]|nr:peptide chain release factor N(5)-glutamine methyltransferase [Pseudomonadota bacterium]
MTEMDTVAASLEMGMRALGGHSDSPRLDAELLLCKVLDLSRSALIVRAAEPVAVESRHAYEHLLAERVHGAPVAYLTGTREFWSLELMVTPDVLVPRPETEVLVELALALLPAHEARSLLDLGTGSGAIVLAIASERPRIRATGTDISERALAIAAANSAKLGLRHIRWRLGSWFDSVPGERFDMIVANPPYVAANDPALARLAAEPAFALTSGATGLEALSGIVAGAASHLSPRGWLLLEHGSGQAQDVAGMLERGGFSGIRSHTDYSGRTRVTLGTVHSPR